MTRYDDMQSGPEDDIEEISGPEQYLRAGEELLVYATDIKIKKFTFEAYLTDSRLFLIDKNERKAGVFAKEIPVHSIVEGYLEQTPAQEPVLVLSIRTSDEDIRTMKMVFEHTGEDRTTEVEEWIHLVQHGRREPAKVAETATKTRAETPFIAPQARDVSETIIFPTPPLKKKDLPPPINEEREEAKPAAGPRKEVPPPVHVSPSQTQILFCHHCGRRIPPNANFCPFCGTRMHQSQHEESQTRLIHHAREADVVPPEAKKGEEKRGWRRFFRRK